MEKKQQEYKKLDIDKVPPKYATMFIWDYDPDTEIEFLDYDDTYFVLWLKKFDETGRCVSVLERKFSNMEMDQLQGMVYKTFAWKRSPLNKPEIPLEEKNKDRRKNVSSVQFNRLGTSGEVVWIERDEYGNWKGYLDQFLAKNRSGKGFEWKYVTKKEIEEFNEFVRSFVSPEALPAASSSSA
jgi:hypothetical protein